MSSPENNQRIRLVLPADLQVEMRDFLIDRQARGLSPRTVDWYRQKLEVIRQQLEPLGIARVVDIRPTTVRALLLALGQTHNPGGVHGFYRALRAFLRWWEMEIEPQGWSNPLRKVKPPRVDDPPLEPVSIDDLRAMLTTCQRRRFYGERDRALLLFLLDSGLRRAEFQALDVGHVNLDNGSVVVIRGKGGSGLRRPADSHSGRCAHRRSARRAPPASGSRPPAAGSTLPALWARSLVAVA